MSFFLKIDNQKFVLIKLKFLENFNSKLVQLSPCIKNKHTHQYPKHNIQVSAAIKYQQLNIYFTIKINLNLSVMSSHNFESSVMLEFNSNVMTIPFLFKFLQDTVSESNQEQNVINTVQKNQLKQRIIEANLILKIFNSLDKTEMYGFLKDKDINHLICFLGIFDNNYLDKLDKIFILIIINLGNFSSLSKLEFDCLRNNIESFVVSFIEYVCIKLN